MRPPLWQTRGSKQVYITGKLTDVIGEGPGAVATAQVPDRHHFDGRGGKDVIPLWRDADAMQPNITRGILELLADEYGKPVSAERLFAYAYGILAQPGYVRRFWDELELPPPRLPLTRDAALFDEVSKHGSRLLYLHTWGERYRSDGDDGYVPQGAARCTAPVSLDTYPEGYEYDAAAQTLRVGDGKFSPVAPKSGNLAFQVTPLSNRGSTDASANHRGASRPRSTASAPNAGTSPKSCSNCSGYWRRRWRCAGKGSAAGPRLRRPAVLRGDLPTPTKAERDAPRMAGAQGALV